MSDWTDKRYWIQGKDIDIIRCNVADLQDCLEHNNYGFAETNANKINNAVCRIIEIVKEQEGF